MKKLVALILVGTFVVAACGSSSPAGATPTGNGTAATQPAATNAAATQGGGVTTNECGDGTWQRNQTKTFCGSAKATVKVGDKTYTLNSGQCAYDAKYGFAINAGTMIVGGADASNSGFTYFGLVQQPGEKAMATGIMGGATFVITDGSGTDKVTIAADHKTGSATGTALLTPDAISATFSC